MVELIDYTLIRSMCLAVTLSLLALSLVYMLSVVIGNYLPVLILSVVVSLPIRYLKESIVVFFLKHYTDILFSMTKDCLFIKIVQGLYNMVYTIKYKPPLVVLLASGLILYMGIFKVKIWLIFFSILTVLIIDYLGRILLDGFMAVLNLLNISVRN